MFHIQKTVPFLPSICDMKRPVIIMLIPVLPVERFVKYTETMGMGSNAGVKTENLQINKLPHNTLQIDSDGKKWFRK